MNTIVNRLLEVDREARRMLDEAQQYRERTQQEIEREKQRLIGELEKKADSHRRELEEQQSAEVQEAVTAIHAQTERRRAAMKTHYDRHHKEWEDAIYRMVTDR